MTGLALVASATKSLGIGTGKGSNNELGDDDVDSHGTDQGRKQDGSSGDGVESGSSSIDPRESVACTRCFEAGVPAPHRFSMDVLISMWRDKASTISCPGHRGAVPISVLLAPEGMCTDFLYIYIFIW